MMSFDRHLTQIQTSSVKHVRAEHKGEGSVKPTSQDIPLISRTLSESFAKIQGFNHTTTASMLLNQD